MASLRVLGSFGAIAPLVLLILLVNNQASSFSITPVHNHLHHRASAITTTTTSLPLFKRLRSKFSKKKTTITTPIPESNNNKDTFQTLLKSRRTINEFEKTLPPNWEEVLHRAITTAIYAPNHKRTEPWRFHLLGPQAITKVCQLNAELVSAKKGKEAGEKKLKRWLDMPGWLVVTCCQQKDKKGASNNNNNNMEHPTSLAREDYAAVCCAVQNLCLSLHSEGMGTKWTTGPVNFDERFADAVGFDGEEEYVVGTIWFGLPKDGKVPDAPRKKFAVEDVLVVHG